MEGHKCFGRYSVSLACPHTHALSCCRTPGRYIIQGGLLSASDQQRARRLSKAVLSRSRLKLREPADYLAATGICLPWPIFACLCHSRPKRTVQNECLPGPGSGSPRFVRIITLLIISFLQWSIPVHLTGHCQSFAVLIWLEKSWTV